MAKAATREGKSIVARALVCAKGAADKSGDRLLCAAFFYRFGAQLGVDAATVEALGAQGVSDLLATPAGRQGVEADVGWGGAPWAITYDWLFPLLSDDQKSALLARAAATLALPMTDTQQTGYNQLSGDVPMALALATVDSGQLTVGSGSAAGGPTGTTVNCPLSTVYWQNWFRPQAPFWNYANQKTNWADGGSREGFGYFEDACYTNFATRALWESATGGDQSLEMGYFRSAPYWHAFQCLPDTIGPAGKWPTMACTTTFAGGSGSQRGGWSILKAATRFSDPAGRQLARWLIDQAQGWSGVARTPGDDLLFGLLIGDPRVPPSPPAAPGGSTSAAIPLQLVLQKPGEFFARSDWTAQANLVWFANHTTASRVTPAGELMLYSNGNYLLGNAAARVAHSYAPRWLVCGVCFVAADGKPACTTVNAGSVPDYTPRGTFVSTVDSGQWTVVAESAPNFTQPVTGKIGHCTRTFTVDSAVSTITLTDDILCERSLTPHLVFPCPTQPQVTVDSGQLTVVITNGPASCTLTFASDSCPLTPDSCLVIGGPANYCDGLPGTAYAGKPYLLPGTVLDADFAKLAAATDPAGQAAASKQMGFWRLHVVLPAGGGKVTTTIKVQ
jgi:hypothetical protein